MLVAAALVVAFRLEVTTAITHFLPEGADRRTARISRAVADSELTRTVVLTLGGPDQATLRTASRDLAEALRDQPHVAWVQSGDAPGLHEAFFEIYFPRRLMFLSEQPERELPERLSDRGLAEAARELKRQLALPRGPLIRRIAPEDPLLAFPALLDRIEASRAGDLEIRRGQLMTSQGRGVVLLGSRGGAFDTSVQRALQGEISRTFDRINTEHGGTLDLDQAGSGRFAIASEGAIKSDIQRISILSTVAIVLLFLVLFRSVRALGLVALPLLAGVLGATAVGLLVFGRLHGLTLGFGASLIGVCIDYAVHLEGHHFLAPHRDGPAATLRRIWPALVLGALTTVAGLGGLAWTSLPGIREIAVFASTGVILALIATRLMLPPLLPRDPRPPALLRGLSRVLSRLLEGMIRRRRPLIVLPLAAIGFSVATLSWLRWEDDISALQEMDPELLAEDRRVRRQVSQVESARFVVALGADLEEALRRNDQVYQRLIEARSDGVVGDFRSLHTLLWSAELQRRNLEALRRRPELAARTESALAREGFRAEMFQPFGEALDGPAPDPLRFEDLTDSPLADMVRPFRIDVGDGVGVLTFLRDLDDPTALMERISDLDGVVFFDQFDFLSGIYRRSRTRTVQLMAVGLVAVFLMVLIRYRRLRLALAAFAPALLAAGVTLGVIALIGEPANLLHLLGLLLVLSMGVDYGVFMVESRGDRSELAATAVGVVVACLSTVCAFGLLALSDNPAMRAMGLTTGVGVLLSLLLAPTALVLLDPSATAPASSIPSRKGRDR